jgi:plastocyanin
MDVFYFAGIALVIAALVIAYVGISGAATFPPSRPLLAAGIAVFAVIVGATMAFAIDLSEEEQAHRESELAEEVASPSASGQEEAPADEGAPTETPAGQPQASEGGEQQPPQPTETALDVSSPEDGSLVFEPSGLEAKPGNLSLTYTNPSPVQHNVAVETADGNTLGETPIFADGEETLELSSVAPGKYVFYCAVPGHREAGMEGDLTVGG